jgi:hypothetical protein
MDKKGFENKQIIIYWWNMGKKTLDYRGTYKGFLKQKGIKVRSITKNNAKYLRFYISVGSSRATLDTYDFDYLRCCDDAIKIFLTLMGDKAKLITPYREYSLNW